MQLVNIPEGSVAVTPSDSTNYTAGMANGFMVAVTGNVVVIHKPGDSPVQWYAVAGVQYACRHVRINSTSTTATGIVALY